MAEEKLTGRAAVLKLRDEMLQLVAAYNAVGMYDEAGGAQKMAVALHKFEDEHVITNMAWPPRLVERDEMQVIEPADDDGTANSLFCLHRDYR